MINSKNMRFMFGLIFLFSIFLFMGTESTGCLDCDKENNASLTVTNGGGAALKIVVSGETNKEFVLSADNSNVVWLEPGPYTLVALAAPFYKQTHYSETFFLGASEAKIIVIN